MNTTTPTRSPTTPGRHSPRVDPARWHTPYAQRHLDVVLAAARIAPGDRVVDVGCGPGKYTVGLAARGFDVTGLDLTPALLDQLREAAPDVTAVEGDLIDPPAELHETFDVVTGFFVLHHLDDLDAAVAGGRRLAKPGGRVVFIEPNAWFPGFYVQVTLTPGMGWRAEKGIVHMRVGQAAPGGGGGRAARRPGHDVRGVPAGPRQPGLGTAAREARGERARLGPRQGVRRGERHRVRPC